MPSRKAPGGKRLEVVGLLDDGVGGRREGRGWTLLLTLRPWRREGGPVEAEPLSVQRACTEKAFDAACERFDDATWVRLRVQLTSRAGAPEARLLEDLGAARPDAALKAAHAELQRPVALRTPELGRMVLDRQTDAYVGRTTFAGRRCELLVTRGLTAEDAARDRKLLERAAAHVEAARAAWPEALEKVVAETYALYTGPWAPEEDEDDVEQPVSLARFRKRLKVKTVVVNPGRVSVHLDAGHMFGGHGIEARLSTKGRLTETCLA